MCVCVCVCDIVYTWLQLLKMSAVLLINPSLDDDAESFIILNFEQREN